MKLTLFLIACLFTAGPSCRPTNQIEWPRILQCAAPVSSALFDAVINVVAADGFGAVFSAQSVDTLEDMAAVHTPAAVACALSEVLKKTAPRGIFDPNLPDVDARRASRIMHFLNERKIEVTDAGR